MSLKNILYSGVVGSLLFLTSCGGGAKPPEPPPPTPSLTQTVSISHPNLEDTCLDYSATLTNVSQATRKILYNGNEIDSLTITTPTYSDSRCGSDAKIGDYQFVLSAENANTLTNNKSIPDYAPVADFSSLDTSLDDKYPEGSQKTFNLQGLITDWNSEDNPVQIDSVEPDVNGRVQKHFSGSGYDVIVKANEITDENISEWGYGVKVNFGKVGELENAALSGVITKIPYQMAFWRHSLDLTTKSIYSADINMDGEGEMRGEIQLTSGSYLDIEPDWSPDGEKLAFTTNRNVVWEVIVMDADGMNQTNLTSDPANGVNVINAYQPAWSPDGTKIAFGYTDSNSEGIAIINVDGSGFTRIAVEILPDDFSLSFPGGPSWSPEGTKIAFDTHRNGNWEIYMLNADGTGLEEGLERLTNNPANDFFADWSPDGLELVFVSDRISPAEQYDLFLLNNISTTKDVSPLVTQSSLSGSKWLSDWFKNGSKILFSNFPTNISQIYVVNSNRSGLTPIITNSNRGHGSPSFRPNNPNLMP